VSHTLSHPFRLQASGTIITIKQATPAHALEVVRHVVSCRVGERGMSPDWGLADPLADGVDEEDIRAAVDLCEPEIELTAVSIEPLDENELTINIDATWRTNE
jgi:hypothetical protein